MRIMANNNEVFFSLLNIHLKRRSFEIDFQNRMISKSKKVNPFIAAINALSLLALFICYIIIIPNKASVTSKVVIINISCLWLFSFISVLLVIFSKQQGRIIVLIGIINYFVFSMTIFTLKKIVFIFTEESGLKYIYFLDNAEMVFLVIWGLVDILDIEYILFLNIGIIAAKITCNSFIEYWWQIGYINSILAYIIHPFLVFVSYYQLKNSRYFLYYTKTVKEQNEWYLSILTNIGTGYFQIRKEKILFMNPFIKEVLYKNRLITLDTMNDVTQLSEEEVMRIYTTLMSNINLSNNYSMFQEEKNNYNCSIESKLTTLHPLDLIKKKIREKDLNKDLFIYIGTGKLVSNADSRDNFLYELYGRLYNSKEDINNEDDIEILFKDVTRVQIAEEKNAEIRLKSVILSKIAHEFKNPLMCLSEMTKDETQSNEYFTNGDNAHNGCSNKKLIQSIASYLLVLVKDIDLFSSIQNGNDISLKITKLNYSELTQFINMIGTYLINKYHKTQRIIFQIINNQGLPEIETDVIKLKQILINLLTNSIKYTNEGTVILEISHDKGDYYKFSVKDTGVGLSDEMQDDVHCLLSFQHKIKYYNYGLNSALGLIIAKEISALLGKSLQFNSKQGKGTSFWFSVLNRAKKNMIETEGLEDSIITIPVSAMKLSLSNEIDEEQEKINIIIADDEALIRDSTKRIINSYAKKKKLLINIYDAVDGIEVLWLVFHHFFKDVSDAIHIIISDENMLMYSGQMTVKKLRKMEKTLKLNKTQFYINSTYSYQVNANNHYNITGFLHKPLIMSDIELIFDNYFETDKQHKNNIRSSIF